MEAAAGRRFSFMSGVTGPPRLITVFSGLCVRDFSFS